MARMYQDERTPLLQERQQTSQDQEEHAQKVEFLQGDDEDPRQWTRSKKMTNVAVIALMAVLSPLASSMFTPGIGQIAETFNVSIETVIGAITGYVVLQGVGPLILAPLSETFGRRALYIWCFGAFAVLQLPTALSPNIQCLIAARTLAGFFGSIGVANGGGSLSDMFDKSERAGVFGWYLLGPLLGPSLGPLTGGVIVQYLGWRWVFIVLTIICGVNVTLGFFFLQETYAPAILERRCKRLTAEKGILHVFEGQDRRPLLKKVAVSLTRPLRILFTQPIVITMALYQALIFASMYCLFTNIEAMFGRPPYNFGSTALGALYTGVGVGYLIAIFTIVPRIDVIFNSMTRRNNGISKPEYRLPLANVGSILLPICTFWFGWAVESGAHWFVCILPTVFWGVGQVAVFNTVQNYYIDAFEKYAASAIAGGVMFRSVVGGTVPLIAPEIFRRLGYGWGWSAFGFMLLAISPSPLIFMKVGPYLRERFAINL